MSYETRLRNLFSAREPDVTLAKLGLLASVILFGLQFLATQPFIVMIPLASGSACALYLVTHNRRIRSATLPSLPGRAAGYVPSLVVVGLAAFVGLVWIGGGRTLPAYLAAAGIGTAILAQVLLVPGEQLDPRVVLFEIALAAVVIRLSALFSVSGYVGVDIWSHVPVFVEGIVQAESLGAIADVKYVMAPIYHLFGAVAVLAFGSAKPAIYLTLGLVVPLAALFVYGAAGLFVPARWALLATALYAFADQFIRWGLHVIPTSLGLVFFLALVYCVSVLFVAGPRRWVLALTVLFSVSIVFTHQVSTAVMLVFLAIATGVATLRDLGRGWPIGSGASSATVAIAGVFVLNSLLTLVSWAFTPVAGEFRFLPRMLDTAGRLITEQAGFLNLASEAGPPPPTTPTAVDVVFPYVELVGFALLLALAVLGGLVMLRWDVPQRASLMYVASAGALFVVTFGLSIFGIRVFLPTRWLAFLYVFLAVVAAVGFQYVYQTASRRTIVALVLVLALAYPVTMVIAEDATYDRPAVDGQSSRYAYGESEVAAVETISQIRPPADNPDIRTDHPYRTLFRRIGGYEVGILAVGADGAIESVPTVYREYQESGNANFRTSADAEVSHRFAVGAAAVCPPDRNVVYANDQVRLCLPAGGAGEGSP